jgi:hypothetical protein
MPQPATVDYEYSDFVFTVPEAERQWTYVMGSGAEPSIRLNAWQRYQHKIIQEYEAWRNKEWEAVGDFGPSSIVLTYESSMESISHLISGASAARIKTSTLADRAGYMPRFFVMTCMIAILTLVTAGLALIPILIMIAVMRYCSPEKFQIKLRRRKKTEQS